MPALSKARFRQFVKLHQKKFRDAEGLFLAEGLRTVRELCQHLPDPGMLVALLVREGETDVGGFDETCCRKLFSISEKESSELALTSTSSGIFGVFRQQNHIGYDGSQQVRSLLVALDDVQDPGNVGTIIRTAVWFGVDALVCGAGSADRYNPKVVRSSAGSIFALHHYGVGSLSHELQRLQMQGYTILSLSLEGEDFRDVHGLPEKMVLVIGNEANGISESVKAVTDSQIRIPHAGRCAGVESLNAAVSAAILMERFVLR